MTVLALPLALLSWAVLSAWAAHHLGEMAAGSRPAFKAAILMALLPLPLIDELLARHAFEALCREQAVLVVHAGAAPGRTVHRVDVPTESVTDLTVPVRAQRWLYLDDVTHQTLVTFSTLQAGPGKLARLVGHRDAPLTFEGRCAPSGGASRLSDLGLVERAPPAASGAPTSH